MCLKNGSPNGSTPRMSWSRKMATVSSRWEGWRPELVEKHRWHSGIIGHHSWMVLMWIWIWPLLEEKNLDPQMVLCKWILFMHLMAVGTPRNAVKWPSAHQGMPGPMEAWKEFVGTYLEAVGKANHHWPLLTRMVECMGADLLMSSYDKLRQERAWQFLTNLGILVTGPPKIPFEKTYLRCMFDKSQGPSKISSLIIATSLV